MVNESRVASQPIAMTTKALTDAERANAQDKERRRIKARDRLKMAEREKEVERRQKEADRREASHDFAARQRALDQAKRRAAEREAEAIRREAAADEREAEAVRRKAEAEQTAAELEAAQGRRGPRTQAGAKADVVRTPRPLASRTGADACGTMRTNDWRRSPSGNPASAGATVARYMKWYKHGTPMAE